MKITGFIGLCKNVGKTTFLNKYIQDKNNYIITSIGWDGEAIDHIFGIKKPSIKVKENNLVCTYSNLKPTNSIKILSLPIENQFLGKLEIYKMTKEDIVQIAGPSSITQIKTFLSKVKEIKDKEKIEEVIIDGAADRRISLSIANHVYYIIGPTFSQNPQKIIRTIQGIIQISQIPIYSNNSQNPIPLSSINEKNIKNLNKNDIYLLDNPSKIIINYELIPKILQEYQIFLKSKPEKFTIVINSFNAETMTHTLNPHNIIKHFNQSNLPINFITLT